MLPSASDAGIGVIAKRPFGERAVAVRGSAGRVVLRDVLGERFPAMGIEPADGDWASTAARFAAFAPGVSAAIVGTASVEHLRGAVEAVERGPLPADEVTRWREAFAPYAASWPGDV
jgi:aryl-alcohol dehydrogenase-like predicted oxidoreductase